MSHENTDKEKFKEFSQKKMSNERNSLKINAHTHTHQSLQLVTTQANGKQRLIRKKED